MFEQRHVRHSRPIRFIALFKLFKAALSVVVGLGALRLLQPGMTAAVHHVLEALATQADRQAILRILKVFDALNPQRIQLIAAGAIYYACLCMVEGLGLWWEKRWAEYVVVIATLSALPFELIALARHLTFTRLTATLVNFAVALYLIHCLRHPRVELNRPARV